ncbi:MAG: chemotaxis protein CheA [Candidatus Tectimicrobiota bacterium]
MNLDAAIQTFLVESRELLGDMEHALLQLENDCGDREAIHPLFRTVHTIKGAAGVFGFDDIVAFTHHAETLLDMVRAGDVTLTPAGVVLLLACADHLNALLPPAVEGLPLDAALQAQGEALVQQLLAWSTPAPADQSDPAAAASLSPITAPTEEVSDGPIAATNAWHLSLRFGPDVLRNGMDPLAFLRYLTTLGDIGTLLVLEDALPPVERLDPEACYLGFELSLQTMADKATIENVFEFVRDDCQLRMLPPHSKIVDYLRLIEALPADPLRLGDMLVRSGALTEAELARGLRLQAEAASTVDLDTASAPPPLGEILVQEGVVEATVVTAALDKQQQIKEHKAQENRFIRVEADKLDQLVTLVGELVISGAAAHLLAQQAGVSSVVEATATLANLVEEVRNSTMSLRMVQIGATFQRFERVVRDVSRQLDKDIKLVISGGETELDKSVVEKLGDPLMHLVRNAIDHGIEPQAVRLAQGKPAQACVCLDAYHDAGSIVIEVSDDGGGLKRDKILARALSRGLITAEQTLSDHDIYQLIFEPGFSTADTVSNLSGRGVGMDVVKSNIEALRGTIDLETQAGQGTTVHIRLPLTLAIIDGFLVRVGQARYVLPLDMVLECIELTAEQRAGTSGRRYINLRGEALPYIRLHEVFGLPQTGGRRENLVVTQIGTQKAGLVVDELLGELQTVIKPLGKLFQGLKGISGSTILGSGEVALIVDIPGLVEQVAHSKAA